MIYSFPYIFILSYFILLAFFENKMPIKRVRFFLFLAYVLFFGCSGYIGTDWINYRNHYYESNQFVFEEGGHEIGFTFLYNIFNYLGFSYPLFKLCIVIIQAALFDQFLLKNSKCFSLCYALLMICIPLAIIDLMRNFTAMLIAVQALDYLKKQKYLIGGIVILFSSLFHISSIIFFLLPFLSKRYLRFHMIILIFLVGIFIYSFQIEYIKPILFKLGSLLDGRIGSKILMNLELSETSSAYGFSLGILEKVFFMILILYKYKSLIRNNIIPPGIFNLAVIYILVFFYLSEMDALINRFSILFGLGYIIFIPALIKSFTIRFNKSAVMLILLVFMYAKTFIIFNKPIYKYTNILFSTENITERINNVNTHYN